MANQRKFEDYPILCWTIDDWQQFRQAIQDKAPSFFNLDRYVERYRSDVYNRKIDVLFSGTSIKLNLGGESEKSRITTTERPIGIFDFSLASQGLYRVQEYFSEKLAREFPDKFKEFELPSGVVPVNLVKERTDRGTLDFYYEDADGYFPLEREQRGTAAINQGVQGAKLDFATKTKKVYLTFKRNRGKVKYVEIYSIFYYSTPTSTSLKGDTEFAIRHIPAMMVAEYLESMGIMTRVYMTRFVELEGTYRLNQYYNGSELPMYNLAGAGRQFRRELFVQPIIVKEFGEELDKSLAFMVSSSSFNHTYNYIAEYAQSKEVDTTRSSIQLLGYPNFQQEEYFVGIERYRNKYKSYVDLGIFKSKEVLPEAMLFFHDEVIATRLRGFADNLVDLLRNAKNANYTELSERLADPDINPFFSWWMKLSANNLKDKINIINSNELQKDIYLIRSDLEKMVDDFYRIIDEIQNTSIQTSLRLQGRTIINSYKIIDNQGKLTFKDYITSITNEITTYADGSLYATDDDTRERRDELVRDVLMIVSALPN
jgi:hypothetical protein